MKKAVQRWLARRGYTVTTTAELPAVAATTFLRDLFSSIDFDLVIDVGGNRGQFRRVVREELRYRGPGISFEPVPRYATELSVAAASDATWAVEAVALGARDGTMTLNVDGQLSSFLRPDHTHTSLLERENPPEETAEVPVRRLESYVPKTASRVFLKTDTQGYDLNVLRGAAGSTDSVAAIMIELSFVPIYEGQPDATEVSTYVQSLGFSLAGIFRNNQVGYPTLMIEGDGVFVRNNVSA